MASTINASTSPAGIVSSADASGVLQLQTGGTAAVTVDASQNVGIGTASPAVPLDVISSSSNGYGISLRGRSSDNASTFNIYNNAGTTRYGFIYGDSGGTQLGSVGALPAMFYTNGSERMRIDSSGNVGIGTSSPAAPLDVQASSGVSMFRLTATSGTGAVYSRYSNTGGYLYLGRDNSSGTDFGSAYAAGIWSTGAYPMLFGTNGTEKMRITSSGQVIIGATSSGNKFSVFGNSSTETPVFISDAATATGAQFLQYFLRNGVNVGSIQTSSTTTLYVAASDYRLKDNVVPMVGALEKISQLNPVTWSWKSDGSDGQGFIAHELQEVVPDCVTGEKDAVDTDGNPQYQGIDTSFLVATLTAAIQELKAIVDTQAEQIKALEAK